MIDGTCRGRPDRPRVLVYSRENLWTHPGNPAAQRTILAMCESQGFSVTVSRDPAVFEALLGQTDVVVFGATSGPVLDDRARTELESWLRNGGGLVGLHTADATELDWPAFQMILGGTFDRHAPGVFEHVVTVETEHPIVAGLPRRWLQTDEIHVFRDRPENTAMTMLLAVDETTLPETYGSEFRVGYHPVAWAHELYGGRVFFTCMGHGSERYDEPLFVQMLERAIEWTAGPQDP